MIQLAAYCGISLIMSDLCREQSWKSLSHTVLKIVPLANLIRLLYCNTSNDPRQMSESKLLSLLIDGEVCNEIFLCQS